jgi:hypothetical protein
MLGGLLDFAARELQVQVIFVCKCFKFPLFVRDIMPGIFGILLVFWKIV